jgi:hypothetical protein
MAGSWILRACKALTEEYHDFLYMLHEVGDSLNQLSALDTAVCGQGTHDRSKLHDALSSGLPLLWRHDQYAG